jgi:hypothetical protein
VGGVIPAGSRLKEDSKFSTANATCRKLLVHVVRRPDSRIA